MDYSVPGEISISIIDYVKEMIKAFPEQEELNKKANTLAAAYLFQTRDASKLTEEQAKVFHHIIAKGLFLYTRSRVDIQPTITFLTTRVKAPDVDD